MIFISKSNTEDIIMVFKMTFELVLIQLSLFAIAKHVSNSDSKESFDRMIKA